MITNPDNSFSRALRIAAEMQPEMRGQRTDLKNRVEAIFEARSTAQIVADLSDIEDAITLGGGRKVPLDVTEIGNDLREGRDINIGFSAADLRLLLGSSSPFASNDDVLITLAKSPNGNSVLVKTAVLRDLSVRP